MTDKKYTVHADKRTSCAYLVYDGEGNFLHDYADDGLAAFIETALNEYDQLRDKLDECENIRAANAVTLQELRTHNAAMREALEYYSDDDPESPNVATKALALIKESEDENG